MSEGWAIALLGLAVTVGGAIVGWIVNTLSGRVSDLERTLQRVEIDAVREARETERDIGQQLAGIRETLARIEMRLGHLEGANGRSAAIAGNDGGPGSAGSKRN